MTNTELIQRSWYRQGYIDGINKQEPQWILEDLKYKENPKYGQPLETVTDCYQLEDELDKWRHTHFHGKRDDKLSGEYLERTSQLDLARHFAKWGAEHLKK